MSVRLTGCLSDRASQTINGVTTNYVLDQAAPLTQVPSDGTNAYLYGNGRIGEEQPGGWQYHLGDALGSVRQLADANVSVTLSRAYEPFGDPLLTTGSGSSIYAFTGEQLDGTGLLYLRARYYAPYLNQWIQPDPIVPDPTIPADWKRYAYVRNNPVNGVDPTGRYPQVQVHRNLSLTEARNWGPTHCRGRTCAYVEWIAQLIAMGDFAMDSPPLWSAPVIGEPNLHFVDQDTARRNALAAVNLGEPYMLGAALHQVQDWYSHWNEGFHSGIPGHAETSFLAGCRAEGACRRTPSLIDDFYAVHTRADVEQALRARYPGAPLATISDDKLIDLYLQEFTTGARHPERLRYGYDTDYYFGFTTRDMNMRVETIYWVMRYFETLEPCLAETIWLHYTAPNARAVVAFLE